MQRLPINLLLEIVEGNQKVAFDLVRALPKFGRFSLMNQPLLEKKLVPFGLWKWSLTSDSKIHRNYWLSRDNTTAIVPYYKHHEEAESFVEARWDNSNMRWRRSCSSKKESVYYYEPW
jgi:hypothetical protein